MAPDFADPHNKTNITIYILCQNGLNQKQIETRNPAQEVKLTLEEVVILWHFSTLPIGFTSRRFW